MAKLSSKEDRQFTKDAVTSSNLGNILKLDEGHNFVVLLDEGYEENFVHWVHIGEKKYRRVCRGGLKAHGWAPVDDSPKKISACEICALAAEQFEVKKDAKEAGDTALAEEYNKRGNNLRAGYVAVFQAIKFKVIMERIQDKKGKPRKRYVPDYDEMEVGKLNLTYAQAKKLLGLLREDEETGELPFGFIQDATDLVNRPLDFIKKKEEKKLYAEVQEVKPSKKLIELEINDGDVPDISGEFDFIDDLDKLADLYRGEIESTEEEDFEEQELEKKESKKSKSGKSGKKKKTKTEDEDDF